MTMAEATGENHRARSDAARLWFARSSSLRLGIVLGVLVLLAKLPLVFTTLGEQDHGRLLIDAVVYVTEGSSTLRSYGIFTSPLWTLSFAGMAALFGVSQLVLISNVGGWLCGGLATMLAFVLLGKLGASRGWAAAGAVASGLVPGTFYLSLYGYPSQYALPFLLGSAVAFVKVLETKRWVWLAVAAAAYCALALVKIDFAMAGTFLLSVAIITRRTLDRRTWLLPIFAILALTVAYLVGRLALDGDNLIQFLTRVDQQHPWKPAVLVDSSAATGVYACGFGTLLLGALALAVAVARRAHREDAIRIAIAWIIGALPLWLFWLARPPMSSRHAVPGAIVTVLLTALLASRVVKRPAYAALVWLIALVVINWPFGEPNIDFNYRPSGNLASTLSANRRAFAVGDEIARTVTERREDYKVILGLPQSEVLGGIDFNPAILVEMASQSKAVRVVDMKWAITTVFTADDDHQTRVFPYLNPVQGTQLLRYRRIGFYTPWIMSLRPLTKRGVDVVTFDANEMFEGMGNP
jgi:hypothetical protein